MVVLLGAANVERMQVQYTTGWLNSGRVRPGEYVQDPETDEYNYFPSFRFSRRTALMLTYPKLFDFFHRHTTTLHLCGCRTRFGANVVIRPQCLFHGTATPWSEMEEHVYV